MVTMIRSDLDFILAQIKIAEADANNVDLLASGLIPNSELPWGLRRVDGSNNNLLPNQANYGSADQPFPNAVNPSFVNETDDGMAFGPPIMNAGVPINFGFSGVPAGYIPQSALFQKQSLINSGFLTEVPGGYQTPTGAFLPANFQPNFLSNNNYATNTAGDAAPDTANDPTITNPRAIQPGDVVDADPRIISNLIVDQTLNNPAVVYKALVNAGAADPFAAMQTIMNAVAEVKVARATPGADVAAKEAALEKLITPFDAVSNPTGLTADGLATDNTPANADILKATLFVPNVAPDAGLSSPFNGWMTLFGQFFDHGLDLVGKGGFGTVYIPLQPDDPLYVRGSSTNFMALTRSTLDANGNAVNKVTPFVDQNQTYTSNPSAQVFHREYELRDGKPFATGRLLNGADGGLATWADIKNQAKTVLGIELNDMNIHDIPEIVVDHYGNFIPGANGFPQLVRSISPAGVVTAVEGSLTTPVKTSEGMVSTGHAFLDDIAHNANPDAGERADEASDFASGIDGISTALDRQAAGTYDNELLDRHFITGDGRGNENIGLTAVHHVFHSEHNRQVGLIKELVFREAKDAVLGSADAQEKLAFLNEWLATDISATQLAGTTSVNQLVWDGERVFQAAKVPTEMQYQHLVFEEFARTVQPFVNAFNDYNGQLNSAILAEFAHTVYRFGHSMLTETVDRLTPDNKVIGPGGSTAPDAQQIGLIEAFLNPVEFNAGGLTAEQAAGAITRGMTRQVGNEIDEFVTEALRNNLVGLPLDLAALNIARGRETGVPTLNAARADFFAGSGDTQVRPYESWADFAANLKNPASVINFIAAYGTHDTVVGATTMAAKREAATKLVLGGPGAPTDRLEFLHAKGAYAGGLLGGLNAVDFWIGGLAEKQMAFGGMLGTTFNFVFEVQLENLQNGDRFYYLSRLANLNLTAQLENNKFAEMIHRNTDATHLPGNVFKAMDYQLEVDQKKQFNHGAATWAGADTFLGTPDDVANAADPEGVANGLDPFLGAINGDKKVVRSTAVDTVGNSYSKMQFIGGEHVVLGGTEGKDWLVGDEGDDTLWGDGGDDRLEGGIGNDFIFGGDGNDIITDQFGDDEIRSGAGDDVVTAGQGVNLIITDTGNDFVWAGDDLDELLLGQGDDFGAGGADEDTLIGGEGNDWLESGLDNGLMLGDNGDLVQGLPIKRSVDSPIVGHDVMVATGGNADFDAETGDDIMVGGLGTDRFFGAFGFDWATYKFDPYGIEADMNNRLFSPPSIAGSPGAILDRYAQTEALSGSSHTDFLRGDDETTLAGGAVDVTALGLTVAIPPDHALKDENVALIQGLDALLGGINEAGDDRFSQGNILLGGSGSDIIEGRGGNDIIDGNQWLNVRIAVHALDAQGRPTDTVLETVDGMSALQERMFSGAIKVAQLKIVREIVDDLQDANGKAIAGTSNVGALDDVDVAQYSGNLADYTIEGYDALRGIATDQNGDGFISVTDNRAAATDGVDFLKNMERVLFADGSVKLTRHENRLAEGRVDLFINGTEAVDGQAIGVAGQVLSASMVGVTDRDNVSATNATGRVTGTVNYTWQVETAPGSGVFTNILNVVADEQAPARGPTFTVTAAEAGLAIRVVAQYKDADNVIETVYSNADEGGNPNEPPTIALDGFNTATVTAFSDNFNAVAPNSWVATANTIQIDGADSNQLRFNAGTPDGATITRALDLSAAASATVTFDIGDTGVGAGDNESLVFEFSADGTTFTPLQTFNGQNGGNGIVVALPTNLPYTANAAIRFRAVNQLDDGEFFFVDNLTVSANIKTPVTPPIVNLASTFTENQAAAINIASEPLIVDEDSTTFVSARVVLTNASAGDQLQIGALPAGISGTVTTVGATIVATLIATTPVGAPAASAATFQDAIQAVTYRNVSENPAATPRIVEVTVNDGVFDSLPATHTITVVPVDDPMVANDDFVVTNFAAGVAFNVNVADLLANDTDPDQAPAITAITAATGLTLPVAGTVTGATIAVQDNAVANGTFTYRGTSADTALVNVTRDNVGALDGTANAEIIIADGAGSTINGNGGNDIIYAGAGNDTVVGGAGNDTMFGEAGDDTFTWAVNDGTDTINGGTEGTAGDRFTVTGSAVAQERFTIYAANDANVTLPNGITADGAEIVVTRQLLVLGVLVGNPVVVARLTEIEELTIQNNAITVPGGFGNQGGALQDQIRIVGDFTNTSLNLNTITIEGTSGADTVDISALTSAHRIVFRSNGGNDTIIGNLRPQDVIELPAGSDPASFTHTFDAQTGLSTLTNGQNHISYSGNFNALSGGSTDDDDDDQDVDPVDGDDDGDDNGTDNGSDDDGATPPPPSPVQAGTPVLSVASATSRTLVGGSSGETLFGDDSDDNLVSQGGSDQVFARGGDDIVIGGDGDDHLDAGDGDDVVIGGGGRDQIFAGNGNDMVFAELGEDMVWAGAGNDTIFLKSGSGVGQVRGEGGIDTLDLSSLTADALVDLNSGQLSSGGASMTISGIEHVIGGRGNDTLVANAAQNVLEGGAGNDTFVFQSAADANGDQILGFQTGDKIDFRALFAGGPVNGFEVTHVGADTVVSGEAGGVAFAVTVVDQHIDESRILV